MNHSPIHPSTHTPIHASTHPPPPLRYRKDLAKHQRLEREKSKNYSKYTTWLYEDYVGRHKLTAKASSMPDGIKRPSDMPTTVQPSNPRHPKEGEKNPLFTAWKHPTEPRKVFRIKATLIVAPPTIAAQWKDEFTKFAPSLKVYVNHSSHKSDMAALRRSDNLETMMQAGACFSILVLLLTMMQAGACFSILLFSKYSTLECFNTSSLLSFSRLSTSYQHHRPSRPAYSSRIIAPSYYRA